MHTIQSDDAEEANEREEAKRRVRVALVAHQDLQRSLAHEHHAVVRKAYDQACAQLIPVRHLLPQVAA